jgi:hypothetical protein
VSNEEGDTWWWIVYLFTMEVGVTMETRVIWCDDCNKPSLFGCGHRCRCIRSIEAIDKLLEQLEEIGTT